MLPSLRGLHALRGLAEHGSLTVAADYLGVTRSALSHRIGDLEAQLGVALLKRQGRMVALTDEAEALLLTIGDAVDRIEQAVEPLHRRQRELRISTVNTFASLWLFPRLGEFRSEHPDIELSVSTTRRVVDLQAEEFDCAIRHGLGGWEGLNAHKLFDETLVPVASISVLGDIDDIAPIRSRTRMRDWDQWWRATSRLGRPPAGGLVVETRAHALEAALGGAGAVMIDAAYVNGHLNAGTLRVLGASVRIPGAYFLVHRRRVRNDRLVKTFRAWLHAKLLIESSDGNPLLGESVG